MADRTLTVNGQPFTFNRDRFAGVRTMEVTQPLSDETTSIQVTVAGHSDLDGIYTGSGAEATWTQQGGNGLIATGGYNSENNDQTWFVYDNDDNDPNGQGNHLYGWGDSGSVPFPWSALPASTHNVQITPVPETVTVDRTASVIDSDRKGESRPLLSKVVGGAAAAYSLRDLNDKAGNNKVVEVIRSSDNTDRTFLAKEVSNGTLEAWVNEDLGVTLGNATAINNCTITDASSTGFTYTASGTGLAGARVPLSQTIPAGATINITLTTTKSSNMTPTLRLARGSTFTNAGDPMNIANSTAGTQTLSVKATAPATSFVFFDNVVGTFTISDFKINSIVYDGYVSKWYDQSGNGNHAIQPTSGSQPKIVEAGSLLTAGVTFDEANETEMATASAPVITAGSTGTFSAFSVQTIDNAEAGYLYGSASTSNGTMLYARQTTFTLSDRTSISAKDRIGKNSSQNVMSAIFNNADVAFAVNGSTSMTQGTGSFAFSAPTSPFKIGNRHGGTSTGTFLTGSFQEIIIYNTDQTANRPAIEANINNQYDIY